MHDLSIRKLKVMHSRVTLRYEPYRKWSIKHRGAYLIIPVIGAALIRERVKWGVY